MLGHVLYQLFLFLVKQMPHYKWSVTYKKLRERERERESKMENFFLFKFELNPKYTKCNRTICWTLLKEKVLFLVYLCFCFFLLFCFFSGKGHQCGERQFLQEPGELLFPQLDSSALPLLIQVQILSKGEFAFFIQERNHIIKISGGARNIGQGGKIKR